ncbi:hypothetical protein EXN66_Car019637 [Channa argus]|uniref:Uncharacterized protein n=1 Tax=Channa argus TaxID=215402 RepID=A0A6G1QNK9_CHAAH|nr:hypothetical protein EXN66_Car019637 [Channa argus]
MMKSIVTNISRNKYKINYQQQMFTGLRPAAQMTEYLYCNHFCNEQELNSSTGNLETMVD